MEFSGEHQVQIKQVLKDPSNVQVAEQSSKEANIPYFYYTPFAPFRLCSHPHCSIFQRPVTKHIFFFESGLSL